MAWYFLGWFSRISDGHPRAPRVNGIKLQISTQTKSVVPRHTLLSWLFSEGWFWGVGLIHNVRSGAETNCRIAHILGILLIFLLFQRHHSGLYNFNRQVAHPCVVTGPLSLSVCAVINCHACQNDVGDVTGHLSRWGHANQSYPNSLATNGRKLNSFSR